MEPIYFASPEIETHVRRMCKRSPKALAWIDGDLNLPSKGVRDRLHAKIKSEGLSLVRAEQNIATIPFDAVNWVPSRWWGNPPEGYEHGCYYNRDGTGGRRLYHHVTYVGFIEIEEPAIDDGIPLSEGMAAWGWRVGDERRWRRDRVSLWWPHHVRLATLYKLRQPLPHVK